MAGQIFHPTARSVPMSQHDLLDAVSAVGIEREMFSETACTALVMFPGGLELEVENGPLDGSKVKYYALLLVIEPEAGQKMEATLIAHMFRHMSDQFIAMTKNGKYVTGRPIGELFMDDEGNLVEPPEDPK